MRHSTRPSDHQILTLFPRQPLHSFQIAAEMTPREWFEGWYYRGTTVICMGHLWSVVLEGRRLFRRCYFEEQVIGAYYLANCLDRPQSYSS
ncbi:hypothetical protein TNCV_3270841 [Trichonephila clavipes]|nr:hypothetical protein TNCV_3270841 [Trichonephila clavipes]